MYFIFKVINEVLICAGKDELGRLGKGPNINFLEKPLIINFPGERVQPPHSI